MPQGETTTKVSREQAELLFKARLKQRKDDFDKVTKKLLNYETRTLVDKSKLPEFRGELVLVYNELIAFIHVNFDLFNENSKKSLCEYITECKRRVSRCCDALNFTVVFPNETLELIDQTAILDSLDDTHGASTSGSQSKQKETIDEIDDSIIENISMEDNRGSNTENLNSSKMALTQEAKDYFRLANQIVNTKFMGEPTELATFIDQIDLLDGDHATVNNFYKANLRLSDNHPVYIRNYRTSPAQLAEINSQVSKLIKDKLIEFSQSSYNSPLIIVPKKSTDGKPKFRMCVDFRALNKKKIPDAFPMPRMDEILDGLGRAKYFSILDLHSGYHQIQLTEESKNATAFNTNSGLYQWKVLPFGNNVAPAHFSIMMKIAFSNLTPDEAFSYMDDLIVVGFSETQHIQNLRKVFEVCRRRNLKLNSEKCHFFQK